MIGIAFWVGIVVAEGQPLMELSPVSSRRPPHGMPD